MYNVCVCKERGVQATGFREREREAKCWWCVRELMLPSFRPSMLPCLLLSMIDDGKKVEKERRETRRKGRGGGQYY